MAPEMLLKHKYDARVDLWSVGVIMYECLFGKAPYSGSSFQELADKIKSSQPIEVRLRVSRFIESYATFVLNLSAANISIILYRTRVTRLVISHFFVVYVHLQKRPYHRPYIPSPYSGVQMIRTLICVR